jgi:hypothetical protein
MYDVRRSVYQNIIRKGKKIRMTRNSNEDGEARVLTGTCLESGSAGKPENRRVVADSDINGIVGDRNPCSI